MPETTTSASVDLRTHLADTLITSWAVAADDTSQAMARQAAERDARAVVEALEQLLDPADLPARMAEMLNSHEWEPGQPQTAHGEHNYHVACAICQGDVPGIAEVAGSVRWTAAAQAVAAAGLADERERYAVAEHQVTRERLAEARRELAAVKKRLDWNIDQADKQFWARCDADAERDNARNLARVREKLLHEAWDAGHADMDELEALQAAIDRVRHRHRPVEPDHPTGGPLCACCRTEHPCAEIRALEGPGTPGAPGDAPVKEAGRG